MRIIILIAVVILATGPLAAKPGETGGAFLKVGIGARAAGLGDAYTAIAEGPSAIYWNPAGLSQLEKVEVMFMHNQWLLDEVHGNFIGIGIPIKGWRMGLALKLYNNEQIPLRGDYPTTEPLGYFSAHDAAATLSLAYTVRPGLSAGLNAKLLYEKIYTESALGAAFDAGVMYRVLHDRLRLAASVRNLGWTDQLYRESIKLPQLVNAGASYRFTLGEGNHVLASGELYYPVGGRPRVLNGLEVKYSYLALRYGFKSPNEHYSDVHTFGAGFLSQHLEVNYAWVPFRDDLGNTHRIAVVVRL